MAVREIIPDYPDVFGGPVPESPACSGDCEGFVYVLVNETMPGLVKIGRTKRLPEERSSELFTTGVATPFKVKFAIFVMDMNKFEQLVHGEFSHLRVNTSREFFQVDANRAVLQIINLFVNELNHEVTHRDCWIDPGDYARYAGICGVEKADLMQVMDFLPPSAWLKGVANWLEVVEEQRKKHGYSCRIAADNDRS